jgi:putative ATP-binding cassette transporter
MLIVAPQFIRGEVEFGVVTQSAMAFAQLLGAFSLIVNQFQSISSFAAVIVRLSALVGAIEKEPASSRMAIAVVVTDRHIAYKELTLFSSEDGRELVKNLSVDIPRGTRVLVIGSNEAARTALFHATAGIWPAGVGTLIRPPLDAIFFLPQRPYLPPGTLRDVLLRTGQEQVITDDQITSALHNAGLDSVLARAGGLNSEHDWSTMLSLGEHQLLAFTRLTLARPSFAMLDRVNSSLNATQLRQALRILDENSITYIAFAEDAESAAFYDAVLEIDADGTWSWRLPPRSTGDEKA